MSFISTKSARRASALVALGASILLPLAGTGVADAAPSISASPTKGLQAGTVVNVTVRGLDPLSGYYVGLCQNKFPGSIPLCTGERKSIGNQLWVTNSPGGTNKIPSNGVVKGKITITLKGSTVPGMKPDCKKKGCSITLFHDHVNGLDVLSRVPVSLK